MSTHFAERTNKDLEEASRLGNVSNEEFLRRLAATLFVIHERSEDPGSRALASYGLGKMPAFLAGELPGGRFFVTSKLYAVRHRFRNIFGLSLDRCDVLDLVGEVEGLEAETSNRIPFPESQTQEVTR
jgi:hypothetical protein